MHWLIAIAMLPYFILFLRIYIKLCQIRPFNPKIDGTVGISVIVACRNEEDNLPALLDCMAFQDYPNDLFEVIIVDDNSTDSTFEAASGRQCPYRLYTLKNNGTGKKEAIRTGVIASSGRLIVTTDADCTMGKSWLRTIAAFFDENSPDMIIGPVRLKTSQGLFGKFQGLEYLALQGTTAGTASSGNGIMCNGANLAFKKEAYLDNIDNMHFELASGDDVFLLHSIKRERGSKILWLESSDAIVSTNASPTLSSFLTQRRRWISKWKFYSDSYTNMTAVITFSAIMLQLCLLASLFLTFHFILPLAAILILKSIPDLLITTKTADRYGQKTLMYWFFPVQLIYPFYVLIVFLTSIYPGQGEKN